MSQRAKHQARPRMNKLERGLRETMDILHALQEGLFIILDPHRMVLLWTGVLLRPGARHSARHWRRRGHGALLPFTYAMDPAAAMALLLGLARDDDPRRSDLGDRSRRAGSRRFRGDDARRLSDDQARRRRAARSARPICRR